MREVGPVLLGQVETTESSGAHLVVASCALVTLGVILIDSRACPLRPSPTRLNGFGAPHMMEQDMLALCLLQQAVAAHLRAALQHGCALWCACAGVERMVAALEYIHRQGYVHMDVKVSEVETDWLAQG